MKSVSFLDKPKKRRSLKVENTKAVLESVRDTLEAGLTRERDLFRKSTKNDELETFLKELNDSIPDKEQLDAVSSSSLDLDLDYEKFDAKTLISPEQYHKDLTHRPYSKENFMNRLASFDIIKWGLTKPDCIASFHCARFGWKLCNAIDSLVCVSCKKLIPISQSCKFGLSAYDNAKQLRKVIETTGHNAGCLWKKEKTPVTILSLPQGADMFNYLRSGAASFKFKTFPTLATHYKNIMDNMDLEWLKDITGLKVTMDRITDDSVDVSTVRKMIHFLLLNGWTMLTSTIEDGIKCSSCLRQVPLWVCKNAPLMNEIIELVSDPTPAEIEATKWKPFDPVNNHFWWCPWRRFLEFAELSEISNRMKDSDLENTNVFDLRFEDSKYLKSKAEVHDYERMTTLIKNEAEETKGILSGQVTGAQLIMSISNIMDGLVSKSHESSNVRASVVENLTDETPKRPITTQSVTSTIVLSMKEDQNDETKSSKRSISEESDTSKKLASESNEEYQVTNVLNANSENDIIAFKRPRRELFVTNRQDFHVTE